MIDYITRLLKITVSIYREVLRVWDFRKIRANFGIDNTVNQIIGNEITDVKNRDQSLESEYFEFKILFRS